MFKNLFSGKETNTKTFSDPALNLNCTEFEVNNWTISEFVVNNLVPVVGMHPFPLDELMLMTAAVCRFKPALIFEWGTNIGKSARIFYEVTAAFDIKAEIHSIDLPDDVFHNEHPQNERGKLVRGIKEVTLHQADGVKRSLEIAAQRNTNGNILFFIDGDHSFKSVKNELKVIISELPNAIVLLHDTFFQSKESGYNVGPKEAIDQVLAEIGLPYQRINTNMGLPGMTLLFKKL
jgi:cephalosporin hydroxylase